MSKQKLLVVVMDGVGDTDETYGNAVTLAHTPVMNYLKRNSLYTRLRAHGKAVGLPSDNDMGNSEVGHNVLGAGRVFDQGAKLVDQAIESGELFKGRVWQKLIDQVKGHNGTLHFLGLLSDGNVHSHERHLFGLVKQAKTFGIKKVRVHTLLDGRDVPNPSAEDYIQRLEIFLAELNDNNFNARIASGGGRMHITMDRYEADWDMVERGWNCHVLGDCQGFDSTSEALKKFRAEGFNDDQFIPEFVITEKGAPIGKIVDGDGVVLFNFRGDRAIEISQAFTAETFDKFDRKVLPKVYFAGMMEYDGDLKVPEKYLVTPPKIDNTMGQLFVENKIRQFACSETQKFGHVTYFWNGNRSGYIDKSLEEYVEIPSENIIFNLRPWMKAEEITRETISRLQNDSFDFARINYANGDMVGHTGDLDAAINAVGVVDLMLGRLLTMCQKTETCLLVTADHGNCDEMFEGKSTSDSTKWVDWPASERPKAKTSHTLNAVPFYFYDPKQRFVLDASQKDGSIGQIAASCLEVMGVKNKYDYLPSLIKPRSK